MFLIQTENTFTERKIHWQRKAVVLAHLLIKEAPFATAAQLRRMCRICLRDENLRTFGNSFCIKNSIIC
jgi:hypothetical protein